MHNTKDTLIHWEAKNKISCKDKILIVSSSPFVEYQKIVALNQIKSRYITAVGSKTSDEAFKRTYLDNLARLIYELRTYHKAFPNQ